VKIGCKGGRFQMAKIKGKVTFDEDRCKGCELCVTVCPVKIIKMDKSRMNAKGYHPATIYEMDKCIACANCATICPDLVITVEKED
jgi:2-oxoglutarate ferredoxin oxidoreductase subunit delta